MSENPRIKSILLIASIVLIAVCSIVWFFNHYEYKEVEKESGYSKKARKNDFLAAEFYLNMLDLKVKSHGNRAKLLESHDIDKTIILNHYGPKLSPTHFNNLKRWLHDGGHLIMQASEPSLTFFNIETKSENIKHNQLLEEFGIYADYREYTEPEEEKTENNTKEDDTSSNNHIKHEQTVEKVVSTKDEIIEECKNPACEDKYTASTYYLINNNGIDIDFNNSQYLFDPNNHASLTFEDEYGITLLQTRVGKGLITVLSDISIFKNNAIDRYDHAFLLSELVKTNTSKGGEILLLYSTTSDSVFTLLWKHAKQLCIAFVFMIFITLWSMYNRLGPIVPYTNNNNRNIVEHLNAIARYSYRQDRGMYLLHKSRIACEQFFITRYPALKNMSTNQRIDHLSEVLDTSSTTIRSALYFEPKSTSEYINSSHHLQKLWILK